MIGVRVRGNFKLNLTHCQWQQTACDTPESELQNALSSPLHLHSADNTYFLLLDSVNSLLPFHSWHLLVVSVEKLGVTWLIRLGY